MTGARGALQSRRDQLRFGVLAGLQGNAGTGPAGPLVRGGQGFGGIAQRAQKRKDNRQAAIGQLVGTGVQAAMMFSDPRVKDDMGTVGKLDSGIPVHMFRYKDSPKVHMGVMADQAEKIRPAAVGRHKSGLAVVDYMKLVA